MLNPSGDVSKEYVKMANAMASRILNCTHIQLYMYCISCLTVFAVYAKDVAPPHARDMQRGVVFGGAAIVEPFTVVP